MPRRTSGPKRKAPARAPIGGDGLPDMDRQHVEMTIGVGAVKTPSWYVAALFVGFLFVVRAALTEHCPTTRRALFELCVLLFHTKGRGAQRFGIAPESVDLSVLLIREPRVWRCRRRHTPALKGAGALRPVGMAAAEASIRERN